MSSLLAGSTYTPFWLAQLPRDRQHRFNNLMMRCTTNNYKTTRVGFPPRQSSHSSIMNHPSTEQKSHQSNINYIPNSFQAPITQLNHQQMTEKNLEISDLKQKLALTQNEKEKIEIELNVLTINNEQISQSLLKFIQNIAYKERCERNARLLTNNELIGTVVEHDVGWARISTSTLEWKDGQLFTDLKERKNKYEVEKGELDASRKDLMRLRRLRRLELQQKDTEDTDINMAIDINSHSNSSTNFNINFNTYTNTNFNNTTTNTIANTLPHSPHSQPLKTTDELLFKYELTNLHSSHLKKEISGINAQKQSLEIRKQKHIKFVSLMNAEKQSKFQTRDLITNPPRILNKRYIIMNIVGKGGFAEVHRAYDIVKHKYVVCKIHTINNNWSQATKASYTKHAIREHKIQEQLEHRRIISLFDVFGMSFTCFVTVLEYCPGMDLSMYLKIHKFLAEKEARSIIFQVFEGLEYLHFDQQPPVIHYDLKPGNIMMFKYGLIKLTDFGLSKIMLSNNCTSMALTSQGAGTYYYLPPECFANDVGLRRMRSESKDMDDDDVGGPRVSTKVDIWSAGVILYEMLYKVRPYGHGTSQEHILRNNIILNAKDVVFPESPKTSVDVRMLIGQCLTYNARERLSSREVVKCHSYFDYLRS